MSMPTIGIVGGGGRIGQWFHRFFADVGCSVLISGLDTELTTAELLDRCEVIVLALPHDTAMVEARGIAPALKREQLLMDLCSLKGEIMEAMLEGSVCEVLGTHPMFGPLAKSIAGQNMILCPGRGERWLTWLEGVLREQGASVSRMDAQTHDRNMTIVQGITHIMTIATARLLQRLDIPPAEALKFATPIFRVKLDLIGRLFTYDPRIIQALYGESHHFQQVFELFQEALAESGERMQASPEEGVALMEEIQAFVGDFCGQAVEESDRFLDVMYEE